MDTRYGKRGGKAEENNEANPELLQAVEEDLAQEFEEVPIQPKKRKQMPPKKTSKQKDCSGTIFIFDFNIDISMSLLRLQLLIILRRRGEEKQKEEVQEKDQEVKTP
ncbi:unnamed protein product [Merluccius merluccius]